MSEAASAAAAASTSSGTGTTAGQKRAEEGVPSFEAQAAEKRAKIAHLEAAVANAEEAATACAQTPLAQAV